MSFATLADFSKRILQLTDEALETAEGEELTTEEVDATACLTDAYNCILTRLSARGISTADIANWQLGAEFELDIATFFWGQRHGWEKQLGEHDRNWLVRFDRRKELGTTAILLDDGSIVNPKDLNSQAAFGNFNLDEVNQGA